MPNHNEEARFKSAAISAIKARWPSDVEPFINACEAARKLYKQIDYYQGLLSILWAGKQSQLVRLKAAPQYTMIKTLVPHIFHTGRTAKSFYMFMRQKHGEYSKMAEKELGVSLWRPGGNCLPWVGEYDDERGMPFLEVRFVVQLAANFDGDGAIELMSSEAEFMALVREATEIPAPELRK